MPIRHGQAKKGYENQIIRHIIEQLKELPGTESIIQGLLEGRPTAVLEAYRLLKR